jgi:hypothetical protein
LLKRRRKFPFQHVAASTSKDNSKLAIHRAAPEPCIFTSGLSKLFYCIIQICIKMTELHRTDSTHPDFMELVKALDAELAERDGNDHSFYAQSNKVDKIKHVVVAYAEGKPVGCGAIKNGRRAVWK